MALIIFGVRQTAIGIDELLIKCPSCEKHSWADVMIVSKYFHFFWIPFFPTEKELNIICKECGLKRYGLYFDSNLIGNFAEVKDKFRHPWFTYIGLTLVISLILMVILTAIF
jgi:hypothetical protein